MQNVQWNNTELRRYFCKFINFFLICGKNYIINVFKRIKQYIYPYYNSESIFFFIHYDTVFLNKMSPNLEILAIYDP